MATRAPTINVRTSASGAKDVIVTYTGMLNGDDGQWVSLPGLAVRSVGVSGTFGTGGSLSANCSNGDASGQNPIVGAQPDESAIVGPLTSPGTLSNIWVAAGSFRPKITAGDGTTILTVTFYFVQG